MRKLCIVSKKKTMWENKCTKHFMRSRWLVIRVKVGAKTKWVNAKNKKMKGYNNITLEKEKSYKL